MTEVLIRLAERLPAPELTVVEESGTQRTHFIDEGDLLQVLREALEERVATGQRFFPPNLLGGDLVHSSIWWRPPTPQTIIVQDDAGDQKMITVPLPGLVLGVGRRNLRLVAVRGEDRPQVDRPLYLAPFPNVGEGSVCMGSGEKLRSAMVLEPELAWEALWSSAFTGHSISGQSRKYPYDVRELLFELDGLNSFPEEDLVPLEVPLEEFIHDPS